MKITMNVSAHTGSKDFRFSIRLRYTGDGDRLAEAMLGCATRSLRMESLTHYKGDRVIVAEVSYRATRPDFGRIQWWLCHYPVDGRGGRQDHYRITEHSITLAATSSAVYEVLAGNAPAAVNFPVLDAWLRAVAEDFESTPDLFVHQHGLYASMAAGDGFVAEPDVNDAERIEVDRILRAAGEFVRKESDLGMVCIHLTDGAQFRIRPSEAYRDGQLGSGWRRYVELSRELQAAYPEDDEPYVAGAAAEMAQAGAVSADA